MFIIESKNSSIAELRKSSQKIIKHAVQKQPSNTESLTVDIRKEEDDETIDSEETSDVELVSDEEWIAFCRFDEHSEIRNYLSSINTTYNCGVTHHNLRYDKATKPIRVFSFKPDKKLLTKKYTTRVSCNSKQSD